MWCLASRGRPANLQRFINAYIETTASTPVYVRLDHNDPFLQEYKDIDYPDTFSVVVGKQEGLKAALEEMFSFYPEEQWYGLAADDIVPRTKKWDQELIASAGPWGIAYPDDKSSPAVSYVPTHFVVGGDLVRAVKWLGFPHTSHYFLDLFWQYIGEGLNCITYRRDVVVEHMHPRYNKADIDETYKNAMGKHLVENRIWRRWKDESGPALIAELCKEGIQIPDKNVVLCSYFNSQPDPDQSRGGITWPSDPAAVLPLIESVTSQGIDIKVFHDCFENPPEISNCEWIKVSIDAAYTPPVARWFVYLDYLKSLEEAPTNIFMVDSTDVVMLKTPFKNLLRSRLYSGSEQHQLTDCEYMTAPKRFINIEDYTEVIMQRADKHLLNAGVVGGYYSQVLELLEKLTEYHQKTSQNVPCTLDMQIYNYVLIKYFPNMILGLIINTVFKDYTPNSISWWMHK